MTSDTDDRGPYIFLSYATTDRDRALAIADTLEHHRIPVWIDRRGISGGDLWAAEITSAIRSCAAMALVCSPASVASRNVRQEIQLAWDSERPIVPLMLEPVTLPDEIAYFLQGRQWIEIDLSSTGAWTRELSQLIRQSSGASDNDPPTTTRTAHFPTNIPVPPSPMFGQEDQIEAICSILQHRVAPLITLIGPGGVGKTRLALEVAWRYDTSFDGAIQFVDLAPIRDPQLVVPAIASQLGLGVDSTESAIQILHAALRDEPMLLVLDNWEQVLEAASDLGKILGGLPRLQVVATSREPLRLRAERIVEVSPLSIELDATQLKLAEAASIPAVALYVTRSEAARPGFALTETNRSAVFEICRRLDGLPLAIELAASRSSLLTPELMLERLERRLPLLTGGARDLPERQQTLRNAIAWSDELLTADERAILRRLSVFAGGFTLESALAVTDIPSGLSANGDVFLAIEHLVGHSLLRRSPAGDIDRFLMFETIREYGQERLEEAGEAFEARQRHAAWFLELAKASTAKLIGPDQARWHKLMKVEQDNLRAALAWSLVERPEMALRLTAALCEFWVFTSSHREATLWYERALEAGKKGEAADIAAAKVSAAHIAYLLDDDAFAEQLASEALAVFENLGDERGIARSKTTLGSSMLFLEGKGAEAERTLLEALDHARKSGALEIVPTILNNLAMNASCESGPESSVELYAEAAAAFRMIGDSSGLSVTLINMLESLLVASRLEEAISVLDELLDLQRALQHRVGVDAILRFAAIIFQEKGMMSLAALAAGAADIEIQITGVSSLTVDLIGHPQRIDQLRESMGAGNFEPHWNAGRALTFDAALDEVRTGLLALDSDLD